ncbi:hypothetical protein [Halomonas sp. H10-9-1]|uniref:hypothetical protein n=1 Tax=Halomonas sp. H10-9-1 TaxID=2950871 RepID=UPI0032DF3D08
MADNLPLEQQYQNQLIELVGAERLQKLAHDHREQVAESMAMLLHNPPGIASTEVKEAALAFANTQGEAAADAYERLLRTMNSYRLAAAATEEMEKLKAFENGLAALVGARGKWIKEELHYQGRARQHRAEALRIKALIEKGPGGIH